MRRSARSSAAPFASSRTGSSRSTAKPAEPPPAHRALYVHLPFCAVKCGYCDFLSFAGVADDRRDAVLGAVLHEIATRARDLRPHTVFLGGGTPTFLPLAWLERVMDALRSVVGLDEAVEVTCEANPESCATEKLQLLCEKGVTRFSVGVQSFDPGRLAFLDRAHDVDQALDAFERVRATGAGASLDLMFGVPGQSVEDWRSELRRGLELRPQHISCYNLTFEPGTPLAAACGRGEVDEPPDEIGRDMLLATREMLRGAGLRAYEISNYAVPGHECLHNLNYWLAGDYVGIGPSASSHRGGRRSTNLRPLEAYVRAVRTHGTAEATAETLSPRQRCREALWLGLRLTDGVDLDTVSERTGVDPRHECRVEIDAAIRQQACVLDRARLRVAAGSAVFTDAVASTFL